MRAGRRARYARRLATAAEVPPDLVAFVLLNPEGHALSPGACRNLLLLECAGGPVLFLDDDVRCRVTAIPGATDSVTFGSLWDPSSYFYFDGVEAIARLPWAKEDILGLHERALLVDGAGEAGAIPPDGSSSLNAVTSRMLDRIARSPGRVVVSQMGLAGDVGLESPLPYFLSGKENAERLFEDERVYQAAVRNRLVLRGTRSFHLSDSMACQSHCMAVDNSTILPPFLPVARGEEAVFGCLVDRCVPGALFAAIPCAILHEPGEPRLFSRDTERAYLGRPSTSIAIHALIATQTWWASSVEASLEALGLRLAGIGNLDERDFAECVRLALAPVYLRLAQQLRKRLSDGAAGTRSSRPA